MGRLWVYPRLKVSRKGRGGRKVGLIVKPGSQELNIGHWESVIPYVSIPAQVHMRFRSP
jgi:hypothetical protein